MVLRMFVTGAPPNCGGNGMPQRPWRLDRRSIRHSRSMHSMLA
jgi:hypothetical protein